MTTPDPRSDIPPDAVQTGIRLQIPAYCDRWWMGDRFGDLLKVTKKSKRGSGERGLPAYKPFIEIAHVKLDKSGKVVRVIFADCEVVL